MKKITSYGREIIIVIIMAVALFSSMYVLLGYHKFGLETPREYTGSDEFMTYINTKTVMDEGWIWFSENTGAPFGSEYVGIPSNELMNFEFLLTKVVSIFSDDVFTVVNIQFLLIFPLCAITAFIVLRSLKVNRVLSCFGAVLYSLSPYIFQRSIQHFTLTQCYFVPLSIFLCLWAYRGGNIFPENSSVKQKIKHILPIVICSILVANNGTGYYQFFTCFFIAVTALLLLCKEHDLKSVKRSIFVLGLILFFFVVSLIPYLIVSIKYGQASTVVRSGADGEQYGLKIAQFFIPLNGHGNEYLEKLIHYYNTNMPLVNENECAYLGVGGIIGFLVSLLLLIGKGRNGEKCNEECFMSELILFAILYATIGGFSSLLALTGFLYIRAYNRISIYILFMSICILCIVMQKLMEKQRYNNGRKKLLLIICYCLVATVCIYDVLPVYADDRWDNKLSENKKKSEIDRAFINEIEDEMQKGDMIYQLPYHKFYLSGAVNGMPEYYHYVGAIYSDDLKWSFGGVRGFDSDRWNEYVSALPMDNRINILIPSGFRGIYIDGRAYVDGELEKLCNSIEAVIGCKPIINENGTLLFYSLYPYIEAHPEVLSVSPLEMADIEGKSAYSFEQLQYIGLVESAVDGKILHVNSFQYGPYTHVETGYYQVTIHGENLDVCNYDVISDGGARQIQTHEVSRENGCLVYDFAAIEPLDNAEFRLYNYSTEDVVLSYIEIEQK